MSSLVGKTVAFVYNGGESAGSVRLVLVNEEDSVHIRGTDLNKADVRQYRRDRINGQIAILATTEQEVVLPSNFLVSWQGLSAAQLNAVYATLHPGKNGYWSSVGQCFIVDRPTTPRIEVAHNGRQLIVAFVGEDGNRKSMVMNHNDNPMHATYSCVIPKADYDTFVKGLSK